MYGNRLFCSPTCRSIFKASNRSFSRCTKLPSDLRHRQSGNRTKSQRSTAIVDYLNMGETEEKLKDEVEIKKKEEDKAEDGDIAEDKKKDKDEEKKKKRNKKKKKKEKKEKSENGEGEDEKSKHKEKKKRKNPANKKDPAKLQARLEKLNPKIQALQAKKEEILKLLEEAKQAAENPTQ